MLAPRCPPAMQIASPTAALQCRLASLSTLRQASSRGLVVRVDNNDSRVIREYREGDDEITNVPAEGAEGAPADPSSPYADELPPVPRTEMSAAMKAKLKQEYYGLGGSPNKAMGGNYFLNIILIVSFLAVLSYALGYLG